MWQNRQALWIVWVGAIGLLLSCGDSSLPTQIEFIQKKTKKRVTLHFRDTYSNIPLAAVSVLLTGKDSVLTDSNGIAVIDSVESGKYILMAKKTGYEPIVSSFSLTNDSSRTAIPPVRQTADIFRMKKRGCAINGMIYYEEGGIKTVASNALIECRLGSATDNFLSPVRTDTAISGVYSFSDLPQYTNFTLTVLPLHVGNRTYKLATAQSVNGSSASDTINMTPLILQRQISANFIILNHNCETLTATDSIKIIFSEAVDSTTICPDSISITASGNKILILKRWNSTYTQLILKPFNSQWSLETQYRLYIYGLKSTVGKKLDNDNFTPYSFILQSDTKLGPVASIHYQVTAGDDTSKANYNTTSVKLLWKKLDGAHSYELYKKGMSDSSWFSVTTQADTSLVVSTAGMLSNGNYLQYLVIGKNSISTSPIETSPILLLKDQRKPVISVASSASGFNNTAGSQPKTVLITVSSFSGYIPEPLDTTAKPIITVIENSSGANGDSTYSVSLANCRWTWTGQVSGTISIIVDISKNGAYDYLLLNFRALKDMAGNLVDTMGSSGYVSYLMGN
ncbi:MAG: hypothetical protein JW795_06675 [Chitinivibrionales bacterium]|nr:hypothetical protein [Chitinivibrionales bacterium]